MATIAKIATIAKLAKIAKNSYCKLPETDTQNGEASQMRDFLTIFCETVRGFFRDYFTLSSVASPAMEGS